MSDRRAAEAWRLTRRRRGGRVAPLEAIAVVAEELVDRSGDFVVVQGRVDELGRVEHEEILVPGGDARDERGVVQDLERDRKSTRLNSSHRCSSYAVFCSKKK